MSGYNIIPDMWTTVHNPTTATQATCSKAAPVTTMVHVCTGIMASTSQAGTAQTPIHVYLRDSTTGAGNILWSAIVGSAVSGANAIALTGLNIPGVAGQALTLEFEGAGVAASQQSVTLMGYTRSA